MNFAKTLGAFALVGALASPAANAAVLAVYDLNGASGTTLPVTSVAPGFTFSSMSAVGVSGSAFGNHFYFSGWDAVQNPGKYLGLTMSSASAYDLTSMTFSAESTGTAAVTVEVRSSADGFASALDTFVWGPSPGTLVTSGSFNLSGIGPTSGALDLRFYFMDGTSTFGFANHECPNAGCGLPDVGIDITIHGNVVPEPSALLLAGLGLALIGVRRRRVR